MAETLNPVLGSLAKDPKATEDFSKETDEVIARADTIRQAGRIEEAVEDLMALEKKTRQASDGISTAKLLCKIIEVWHDAGNWQQLEEHILMLARKRGQLKRATTDMITLAMTWIESLDKERKIHFIGTLNEVTEGKIFVEVEKARLTAMLAKIREAEGNVEEAASLLQEVQIETFGTMERREKTEYILNQLRLVLLKKDFVRTQIISKKLNAKLLEVEEFQDMKIEYYQYMVQYWLHEDNCLNVSKCFQSIFNTPCVQADESKWKPALVAHALYLTLASYCNEQQDMLHKLDVFEAKKLDKVPVFRGVVKLFLRKEVAVWPLKDEAELRSHPVFQDTPHMGGAARWDLLKKRVIQNNIKVISDYYEQIHTKRLCELIGLNDKETEAELSELVCSKFVFAKIDRPAGTIVFGKKQNYTDCLNEWSGSISKMLDRVENTCHLIQKEQMVHAARAKVRAKNAASMQVLASAQ